MSLSPHVTCVLDKWGDRWLFRYFVKGIVLCCRLSCAAPQGLPVTMLCCEVFSAVPFARDSTCAPTSILVVSFLTKFYGRE